MRRHIEDVGVVPEDLLGAVAVVDVPVDDEDALALRDQRSGCYGNVVQEAESHRTVAERMVTWWTGRDERHAVVVLSQCVNRREPRSSRRSSGEPGILCGVGVGVDVSATGFAEGGQLVEVAGAVNPSELLTFGGTPMHGLEIGAEVQVVDAGHHRANPSGTLGVAGPMMLGPTDWTAHDQHTGFFGSPVPFGPRAMRSGRQELGSIKNRTSTIPSSVLVWTSNRDPRKTCNISRFSVSVDATNVVIPRTHAASASSSNSNVAMP